MAGYWRSAADRRGFLHLVGCIRDVIIVNAEVRYAGPIETALAGDPDVDQAYAVGAPDERTGEAVHAFIVPVDGRAPDLGRLAERVRGELGAAGVPRTITLISEAPVAAAAGSTSAPCSPCSRTIGRRRPAAVDAPCRCS